MKDGKADCIDTFLDEDVVIPSLPAVRKSWIELALMGLDSDLRVQCKTQQQPAVTKENIRYFQRRNLAREDAECCVWALSSYTGEGSKSASRAGSLCIRNSNMHGEGGCGPCRPSDRRADKTSLAFRCTGFAAPSLLVGCRHPLPYSLRGRSASPHARAHCDLDSVFQQLKVQRRLWPFQHQEYESHHLLVKGALNRSVLELLEED